MYRLAGWYLTRFADRSQTNAVNQAFALRRLLKYMAATDGKGLDCIPPPVGLDLVALVAIQENSAPASSLSTADQAGMSTVDGGGMGSVMSICILYVFTSCTSRSLVACRAANEIDGCLRKLADLPYFGY